MARVSRRGSGRSGGLLLAIGVFLLVVVTLGVISLIRSGPKPVESTGGQAAFYSPSGETIVPDVDLSAAPNIIDHGNSVTLFFPGTMFDGIDLDDEYVEVNRFIRAYEDDKGRIAIEMTKERQLEFLYAFKGDIDYNREYFVSELGYLDDIIYTEDMRTCYFFVDGRMSKEILFEAPYIFSGFFENYQQMLGQEQWVLMTIVDMNTDELLYGLIFPGGIEVT